MPYLIEHTKFIISIVLMLVCTMIYSQNIVSLKGNIIANEEDLSGIHVLNINSKKGVITDKKGFFVIPVTVNDTLIFSSVQFKREFIVIDENTINNKSLIVPLEKQVVELEEVLVRPHNLTGIMEKDIKHIETLSEVTAKTLNLPNAYVKVKTQSERRLYTARTWDFTGLSFKIDPIINGLSGRTLKLKNQVTLEDKTLKYNEIYESINDSLITHGLKIPKDKIYDFYYYCEMDPSFDSVIDLNNKGQIWMFLIEKSKIYRRNNGL